MLAVSLALALITAAAGAPAAPDSLAPVAEFAVAENLAPLVEPAALATDALGQVWAADAAAHRLVRWDARGAWAGEIGALGSDANQFRRPAGLARLGSLGVAVLDVENRRIVAYDHLGRLTDLVITLDAPELASQAGHVTPVALAADRGGAMVLADSDGERLLVFDFAGHLRRTVGAYGAAPGSFRGLAAVACGPRGELVTLERPLARAKKKGAVPDSLPPLARVQWLDPGGTPLAHWPVAANGARDFAIAVDDSGRVAVALAGGGAGEVRLYARDGALLARARGLAAPRAVAFGPDGALVVAEAGVPRLRRFARVPTRGE